MTRLIGVERVQHRAALGGDKDKAQTYLGFAKSLMISLEERTRRNTSGIWMDQTTVDIPGGYVTCKVILNIQTREPIYRETSIYIEPSGGEDQVAGKECWCNCNFSRATVVEIVETEELFNLYNVSACYDDGQWYVLYENVLGTDFTQWEEGMSCIVMPYNDFLFDCCNLNFNATGCNPVVDGGHDVLDEEWRPVFRIVPLCNCVEKWKDQVETI